MSIFLNQDSKVIVQGMTGSEGMKHTTRMLASGTAVVGGVNPRKAGQSVDFPNGDPFFHNVFSLFEGKRFDLGLYEGGTTRFVHFDKPGISFIFCNIHAEMSAVVIALATPYYAISNARGEITFPEVPPGRYDIQVFHAAVAPDVLRAAQREVTLTSADSSLGNFSLAETDALSAHKNKYGRDYDRPDPNSPAYARP